MARGVKRLDQHLTTLSKRSSTPLTFKKVSCCPAKEASGRSSAVALDRTATKASLRLSLLHSSLYADLTAFSTSLGIEDFSMSSRIFFDAVSYCFGLLGSVTVSLIIL